MEKKRAHVFVVRDGLILALRQTWSPQWWELPGGEQDDGEEPRETAVREVYEEAGLRIEGPELLREWSYENRQGRRAECCAYAAVAGDGDVRLSREHTDYVWMTVGEYVERYCADLPTGLRWVRLFLVGVRENCVLFEAWLKGGARRASN